MFFGRTKDFNNNNNNLISNTFQLDNTHPKGRKLIEDFNKFTIGKPLENENNNILKTDNNEEIQNNFFNNNNNNNNSPNFNISNNNNFSLLI